MKKMLLFFFLPVISMQVNAQQDDKRFAMELVEKNSPAIGLSAKELNEVLVSSSYFDKSTGTQMVYLQQSYKGLPVYNQMIVLAFKNGQLISQAGSFNHSIEKFVNTGNVTPVLTAARAIQAALADRKIKSSAAPVLLNSMRNGHFVEFDKMGITSENITAELMWVPAEDRNEVILSWQVYIVPKTTDDYWLIRIDAGNGNSIGIDNLTAYDNWDVESPGLNSPDHSATIKNLYSTNVLQAFDRISEMPLPQTGNSMIVNSTTYRVVPFPAESPIHPGGTPALRTDPWTAAPGNATSLKWHTGLAATDYNYSRGNNVWAYQDQANSNAGSLATSASSTNPSSPLLFDFVPNFTVAPTQATPVQNQQFNITNLFYWNNIIHDVMYQYGFNEVTGNFQDDNQGRGGTGNDHVNAEAQDGSGTNNANFATPVDGSSGRMQMYLWTGTPSLDGDVDNGIIVHEYGHGISTRLTGGPANSSCLQNSEQMGEGWSDYFSLMFTQNWATANLNTGFSSPRGIGTYALNQPITGLGIRPARYCTDMSVNNYTYANLPSMVIPHGVGFVWCTALWDMTWNIINQVGTINPNIYDATGGGGNTIAMRLVTEGLKLQQCSPGFISGRNAILQADQNLYAGAYRCAIIAAFARRGMGMLASEGSTNSISDGVTDFSGGAPEISLTQNGIVSVPEGQNIVYNNQVKTQCAALVNYVLRDTLPTNVTFVSATAGGTYNAADRVVSWTINQASGSTANYGFTVNINSGSYFTPISIIDESVPSTVIPASWTPTSTTSTVWTAHNLRSHSSPNSFFTADIASVSDQILATTNSFALGATPPVLSFWHWYNSESTFDGGVLEVSINGGTTWADIGAANFIQNGYNSTISNAYSCPIGGRTAWSGNNAGFVETKVNMSAYANQPNIKLRWRFASDISVAATGWNVDDISLKSIPTVYMRSSLFTNLGIRVALSDTTTIIGAPLTVAVNLKLFLQGYYAGSNSMQPVLVNQGIPALSNQTDTLVIELYDPATFAFVDSKKAVLSTGGLVSASFSVPAASYFIAVKHRNSIQTWSATAIACNASTALYDFSTGAAMAFGENEVMVEPGVWALYTGDVNQDDFVDVFDYAPYNDDNLSGANTLYMATDMNGDGFVDVFDYQVYNDNNLNGVGSIHP